MSVQYISFTLAFAIKDKDRESPTGTHDRRLEAKESVARPSRHSFAKKYGERSKVVTDENALNVLGDRWVERSRDRSPPWISSLVTFIDHFRGTKRSCKFWELASATRPYKRTRHRLVQALQTRQRAAKAEGFASSADLNANVNETHQHERTKKKRE
ncbi:uncharacterized protein LAESUDRAFT_753463 [Laetiporus sulphureus 93-53]|uniref:Uncharacterized protein n=1 Tax=Laetiporus sulphureus 93-53 TaxID=1314785 RepID=A0A165AWX6_9APHY|nr:uncharacterized protein LAESUDRAFT_753463 [Laetiporus sulphureus 93-53]KZS99810.1 hypothetical protein LAESUDRAFT_753463 [Laetiporus sulphureus 93-53]